MLNLFLGSCTVVVSDYEYISEVHAASVFGVKTQHFHAEHGGSMSLWNLGKIAHSQTA
jgi:hypothetical protein